MARAPPEPSTELEDKTSGVAPTKPYPAPTEGSAVPPPGPPYGFANVGWLNTLKISALNSALTLSLNLNALVTDISKFLKPWSRKILRGVVPRVPDACGTRTDLFPGPAAKQPVVARFANASPPSADAAVVQEVGKGRAALPSKKGTPPVPPFVSVQP